MDMPIEILKTEGVIQRRGGARPGAGRKPKLQFEARELFNRAVDERWNKILQQIDAGIAKGDKDIIRMCVEQRIGRAGQSMSIKSEDHPRPAANLFFQPRIQVAVRILEDQLKQEITNTFGKNVGYDGNDRNDVFRAIEGSGALPEQVYFP